MTTGHPSRETLERFRRGTLAGEELLLTDDHVAGCASCRALAGDSGRAIRALREALQSPDDDHLSFEEMERYADGLADGEERASAEMHLEVCRMCRDEVDDFVRIVGVVAPRRRRTGSYAAAAVLAAVVAGGAALLWNSAARGPEAPRVQVARRAPDVPQPVPVPNPDPLPRSVETADPVERLDPALRRIARALEAGTLESAALVASLRGTAGRQRSSGATPDDVPAALEPVGKVIEVDRPVFRWSRTAPGEHGVVQVFDADYNRVVESPAVAGTSWESTSGLKRGVTYQWQVILRSAAGERAVPQAPEPPARFRVLDAKALADLNAARRSGSQLEAGLICMREGLFEEGAALLAAYAKAHPGSSVSALAEQAARVATAGR